jgi:hypothetical protein
MFMQPINAGHFVAMVTRNGVMTINQTFIELYTRVHLQKHNTSICIYI